MNPRPVATGNKYWRHHLVAVAAYSVGTSGSVASTGHDNSFLRAW
jgi:hypothetical protein